jgi:hypothetical protein
MLVALAYRKNKCMDLSSRTRCFFLYLGLGLLLTTINVFNIEVLPVLSLSLSFVLEKRKMKNNYPFHDTFTALA